MIMHMFSHFKVVPEGGYRYFVGVKFTAVKLKGGRRFLAAMSGLNACPNHRDDGIHSDHGFLDIWDNPLGPP